MRWRGEGAYRTDDLARVVDNRYRLFEGHAGGANAQATDRKTEEQDKMKGKVKADQQPEEKRVRELGRRGRQVQCETTDRK